MARFDEIEVNGSPMRICVASPDAGGPRPAVIVMCHIGGLDEFTEDRVDRLADAGYIAAAPDVFHYHDWIEDKEARRATLRDKSIEEDIRACIAHVEKTEKWDGKRLGILGHCMGGRTAMLGAGRVAEIGPLVIYYGGRTMISWGGDGPTPFERIPNIEGPVIGFFGLEDTEPSPGDVDKIEKEFNRHGIACAFHRYEGAGHAFQNFMSAERYRQAAAEDSWNKTLEFLDRAFR